MYKALLQLFIIGSSYRTTVIKYCTVYIFRISVLAKIGGQETKSLLHHNLLFDFLNIHCSWNYKFSPSASWGLSVFSLKISLNVC